MQGPHHEAKKFTRVTLPLKDALSMVLPSSVGAVNFGTGLPTMTSRTSSSVALNENIIQNYLAKLKIRIPGELLKAPAIHGQVVGVSDQFNLVMLNVGENDQVKPGYEFTIYRGKTFVGRVKVDRVFPDMCACIALQEYHKDTIKKGDDASTRVE